MRQTSLLDSFIKRQKKQEDQPSNDNNIEQQKSKQEDKQKVSILRKKQMKYQLDSDQDQQDSGYQEIRKQIEDLDFNEQQSERIMKKKRGKSSKSQKKQTKQKSEKFNKSNIKQQPKIDNQLAQFTDATPIWAQKQHCLDKNKRNAYDPNYDPTTLYIPQQAWKKFTAPMRQFWKIKSQNFDKVVFFKLGKFYQLFYEDAAISNKYLNLKYMGTKMHTGFPQRCLQKYANQFVELGFKVVIVQQMQTPEQMQSRITQQKKQGRKSDKTINRQITQIFTKGTYTNRTQKQQMYLPNYLLSIRVFHQVYGFSLLQIGTNQIMMGVVDGIDKFKTVLYQTRPVELVYDPDNLNNELVRMMEKTFLQMQLSKVASGKNNVWHPLNSIGELDRLEKQGRVQKYKIFQIINGFADINKNLLYSTLSGLFNYLKSVFKFEYVIETVRFNFYQKDSKSKNMILDSQALQHLQIFETSQGVDQSLFNKIDRTKTKFGKRLLRKWIMSPLVNKFHINQRLNAIEDLSQIQVQREKACAIFKKLPDLDKKINNLYHYAIKTTSASKAIYFEDVNTSKLKQFKQIMERLEEAVVAMSTLGKCRKKFKSTRLKQLVTLAKQGTITDDVYAQDEDDQSCHEGLLPNITSHLEQFKSFVKWQDSVPIPQKGLVTYFDQLQTSIQAIKEQLEKYLDKIRFEMNQPSIKFAHTKQRYEIEIPEKAEKRKPKGFEFSSKKAGYSRYISPICKDMVKRLEKVQDDVKEQMGLFIGFFFQQFKKKHKIWQRFIDVVAEIDCLISLAQYSFSGSKTRPEFIDDEFDIKGARHPCLTNIEFIPNDINLKKKVMLLTGPNMGGKSTILRTSCTLAVLAQVGCYVPADSYRCQIIDRIFTRIGASDKLELGKSTFFIEMQQTKSVLQSGTSKSLAIIDELGRGTSTFDGLAIAYSVLKSITQHIKCYCIFATHYHILIDQFKSQPQVKLMMMDSVIKQNKIVFLYKLVPGNVAKSFGLSVASRVGIGEGVIKLAEKQADKMNKYIEGKRIKILKTVISFLKDGN